MRTLISLVIALFLLSGCKDKPKDLKPIVFTPDTSLDTCGILDHSEIPEIIKK